MDISIYQLGLACIVSYILGSLPYGLIFVKVFTGKDIRTIGSKNIGTTNVLRAGYKGLALLTLVCDSFKGAAAVIIFKYILNYPTTIYAIAGLVAILGHVFPVWLNFKGGKGVASAFGVILALNWILGLCALLLWFLTALLFRYSSLSAIVAFVLLPIFTYVIEVDIFWYTLIISAIVLVKHKDNFIRLYKKEESKITFKRQ